MDTSISAFDHAHQSGEPATRPIAGLEAIRALGPHTGFTAIEDAHFHAIRRMEQALKTW